MKSKRSLATIFAILATTILASQLAGTTAALAEHGGSVVRSYSVQRLNNGTHVAEALPPSSTWLNNHCAATANATMVNNVISPTYAHNSHGTSMPMTTAFDLIREEVIRADRSLQQSHPTFHQHMRLRCTKDTAGNWKNLAITELSMWDFDADGVWECSDVDRWGDDTRYGGYNPKERFIFYLDPNIDNAWCSYAYSHAWGLSTEAAKGTTNPNNSVRGWAVVDSDVWKAPGVSDYSAMITLQEFFHSIGAVQQEPGGPATPGTEPSNSRHTYDFADFMNGATNAYYYQKGYIPPVGYRPQRDCEVEARAALGEFWNTYADCGRDTYWNPTAPLGSWLCTHYNIAWDSLYLTRATRTAGC